MSKKRVVSVFILIFIIPCIFVFANISYNKKHNAKVDKINAVIKNKISFNKEYKIVEPTALDGFEISLDSILYLEDDSNENYIIDKSYFTFAMEESVANKVLNKEYLYGCYVKFIYSGESEGLIAAYIYEK